MGNHRADVGTDSRPSVTPSTYVGKRRALPADEAPVETRPATPYVGKRRAAAAEPERASWFTREVHEVTDERIETNELRALVELELADTAPRPRIAHREPLAVPTPRRPEPHPADTADLPRPLFADDSRVDLPRLSTAATTDLAVDLASLDFSVDKTTLLPAVSDAGRRRDYRNVSRGTARKRRPGLPVVVGVAALAVSAAGVAMTAHPDTATTANGRFTGATALSGQSAMASVGSMSTVPARGAALSRDSSRAEADQAAEQRAEALNKLDAQAGVQDKYLHSNVWVLPVTAGVYHLTGRFGDVSGLWATVHTGLDFAAPYGTPIHAIARGTVTSVSYDGAYGNKTVVTLPDGTEIWYCHQSEFAVSVGEQVDQNQVIGYIGATGNTTGPHVHIEVRPGGGDPVDPDPAFKAHGIDPDANQ